MQKAFQLNRKDVLYIIDGLEIITYLQNEINALFYSLEVQKVILPYNMFNIRNMSDNIIKKAVIDVMVNSFGYNITHDTQTVATIFSEPYFSKQDTNGIVKTITDFMYSILINVINLNINKSYYVNVMTINTNIQILVNTQKD